MWRSEGDKIRKMILCPPGPEYVKVENLEDHNFVEVPDLEKARKQFLELQALVERAGGEVIAVEELRDHPNSVFTRDVALGTPDGFVQVRMGLPTRRGEEPWMSEILSELGMDRIAEIREPGTVEGGDVILGGRVAFVGCSSRTNRAGVEQMQRILRKMGYEVRVQEISDLFLHIGGAMSLVGPDTVVCCAGVFPDGFFRGYRVIEVADESFSAINVIHLAEGEVVLHHSFNRTIDALTAAGCTVHPIDLSEVLKGGGGPTCVTLPIEREA
jgi:dimethylargininase